MTSLQLLAEAGVGDSQRGPGELRGHHRYAYRLLLQPLIAFVPLFLSVPHCHHLSSSRHPLVILAPPRSRSLSSWRETRMFRTFVLNRPEILPARAALCKLKLSGSSHESCCYKSEAFLAACFRDKKLEPPQRTRVRKSRTCSRAFLTRCLCCRTHHCGPALPP